MAEYPQARKRKQVLHEGAKLFIKKRDLKTRIKSRRSRSKRSISLKEEV